MERICGIAASRPARAFFLCTTIWAGGLQPLAAQQAVGTEAEEG